MTTNQLGRVAIIGAGPGGLTLARILQLKGVEVEVYERENSVNARSQGGSLDLHTESGLYALQTAELFDKFKELCRPEGEDLRIIDKYGVVHYDEVVNDDKFDRPEIDRGDLRQLLLDSIKPNTIRQDHCLESVESLGNGQHKLIFRNGATETVDLVVGADGAWSRVRPLVSDAKPTYSGVSMVEVSFSKVHDRHPEISKLVGRGTLNALSDNKGLLAQRNGNNIIRVYITFRAPENWITESGVDFNQTEQARTYSLQLFSDWNEKLLDFVRLCDDNFIPRLLYVLPVDHQWETKPGVTLLGDAAHLMSPFAGEGVNLAMLDATELALAITESGELTKAIHEYEQKMFSRASGFARESASNLDLFISEGDSAEKVANLFKMMMAGGPPGDETASAVE
ncbi:hypothetical protein I4U23_022479 [Adineta vaga]|nr:hypothetical protein I4U23_022479 [Adineta vaga]